ncbi:unnamed protein product [Ambrosiozyma monospora]|uniref:Unnamed protein product n=1 Tax=Ambrosiozyma monospora TaxID=43982 RepID=A0ACB5SU70_AMBMO|nr:unnamed protein product [Ambrosiozyma monospora]
MQFKNIQTACFLFTSFVTAYVEPEDIGLVTVDEDGAVIVGAYVQETYSQTFSLLSEDSLVGSITSTVSDYSTVTAGPSAIVTNPDADEEYGQHKDDEVTTVGEDGAVIPGTPIQKNYGQFDYLLSKAQTAFKTHTVSNYSTVTKAPSAVVTKSDADEKHSHTGDDGATTVGEDGSVIPGTPVQKTHSQTFSLLSEDSLVGSITSTVSDYSTVTAGPSAIVTNPDADEEITANSTTY